MKSTVSAVGDNRVKLSVEVPEADLDKQIDAAFKRIAKQVRIRGFRPGKAPRRVLEAQLGPEIGREEALRTALPDYYAEAVIAHDVDVIDSPELEIVSGADEGPLLFDAVVQTRPAVNAGGYDSLRVQIPSPEPSEEMFNEELQNRLAAHAELVEVDRPADDGDHVTIDILAVHDGEEVPGLTTLSYDYALGSGFMDGVLDENLRDASAGDLLKFVADHPDTDEPEPISFEVQVHEVASPVLPVIDDAWVDANTEFATVAEFRADISERLRLDCVMRAAIMVQPNMAEALVKLVTDEIPETLVQQRASEIVEQHLKRVEAQGHDVDEFLADTSRTRESLMDDVSPQAAKDVKFDLALRYVAEQEDLIPDDQALDEHLAELAAQQGESFDKLKARLAKTGWLSDLRAGLAKQAAGEWLAEHVELVDPDGNEIDRESLKMPSADAEADAAADVEAGADVAAAGEDPADFPDSEAAVGKADGGQADPDPAEKA